MDTMSLKDLKPLKVIIHGPPAAGKTRLANRLSQQYGAKYITVKTMIEETLDELRENIARELERIEMKALKAEKGEATEVGAEEEQEEEEDELGEEEEGGGIIDEWQEQIKYITMTMNETEGGKLPDEYVVRLMKTYLYKEFCQTRGYVLDGYPKTIQQAKELFGQAAESGEMMEGGGEGGVVAADEEIAGEGMPGEGAGGLIEDAGNKIMPDFVISLVASDEFLCQRVMKLPQRIIKTTHYDEKNMLRRLAEFRANNTEENTMLKFFDEAQIHPILICLEDEETQEEIDFECIYNMIIDILGPPIPGLGLTPEEFEELKRLELEKLRLQMREYQIERKLREEKAMREYQDKMEKWTDTLEKLQMEEEKILAAQSEPLRFYLMKNIFPTLTQGLIEVAKIKPDDPVDYLAEYLFRENPEGKMFDPAYTRDGERLLEQYEKDVAPTLAKSITDSKLD